MLTLSLEGIISLYLYHLSVHKLNFKYLIPILTTNTIQPYTDVDYDLYRSRTFLACTQPFHSIPLRHWISRFSYSPPLPLLKMKGIEILRFGGRPPCRAHLDTFRGICFFRPANRIDVNRDMSKMDKFSP